jgi:hypothetical protein
MPLPSVGALPQLAPAPGTLVVATPAPTPRVFRCTCNGPGFPTSWVGGVSASSYILADQQASKACVAYNLNANAQSPYINQPGFGFQQSPPPRPGSIYSVPPGTANAATASGTGTNLPLSSFVQSQVVVQCKRCACN